MPIVAGLVGWITNVLALKMMFAPLKFVGLCSRQKGSQYGCGWQGVIPFKSKRMAAKTVKLLIETGVLSLKEIVDRLRVDDIAAQLGPLLRKAVPKILNKIGSQRSPLLWNGIPTRMRARLAVVAGAASQKRISAIVQDIKLAPGNVFDIEAMVVERFADDAGLLVKLFQKCGEAEFTYIRYSGFFYGAFLGTLQYFATRALGRSCSWWFIPLSSGCIGYITNSLALWRIFHPVAPIALFGGCYTLQGLFLERQSEIANDYATFLSDAVFQPRNILRAVMKGPRADSLIALLTKHVDAAVDDVAKTSSAALPLATRVASTRRARVWYEGVKQSIVGDIVASAPTALAQPTDRTDRTDRTDSNERRRRLMGTLERVCDVRELIRLRICRMTAVQFVGLLRPVFQEDETSLKVAGGAFGVLAGIILAAWVDDYDG